MEGAQHVVRVSAPGKVILHGEHAVVYGKTALAVSLGLRTSVVLKEVNSPDAASIKVYMPSVDLNETINLKSITEKLFPPPYLPGTTAEPKWKQPDMIDHENHLKKVDELLNKTQPNYSVLKSNQRDSLRGLLYTFAGVFGSTGLPLYGMEITLESQLSAGAGTGSSASFAVCLAGAALQLVKLKSGSAEAEFNDDDKKIISAWAYNCERIMHGSPSGELDQSISLVQKFEMGILRSNLGIDNVTSTFGALQSFRRGAGARALPLRAALRVLLVDTRVSRQTSALAGKVAEFRSWNGAAVDCVMEACDHVTRAATQIYESLSSSTDDTKTKELYQRLERLWDMNHSLLCALGVSHAALERARRAAAAQRLACKLTGAGGGGCAIVLVPPGTEESRVEALSDELRAMGFGVADTQLGGDGVRLHS